MQDADARCELIPDVEVAIVSDRNTGILTSILGTYDVVRQHPSPDGSFELSFSFAIIINNINNQVILNSIQLLLWKSSIRLSYPNTFHPSASTTTPDTDCLSFIQIASLLHTLSEKESRKNQRQRQRYQSLNSQLHAYGT